MAKNSRAHPLQSPVPNLQLPAVLPAHIPSQIFHHPANPTIRLSHPFSNPVISHLVFSNRAISITAPRLWNDLPSELHTISLHPPPSLPIIGHHFHLAPPGASIQLVYFLPEFCL